MIAHFWSILNWPILFLSIGYCFLTDRTILLITNYILKYLMMLLTMLIMKALGTTRFYHPLKCVHIFIHDRKTAQKKLKVPTISVKLSQWLESNRNEWMLLITTWNVMFRCMSIFTKFRGIWVVLWYGCCYRCSRW